MGNVNKKNGSVNLIKKKKIIIPLFPMKFAKWKYFEKELRRILRGEYF